MSKKEENFKNIFHTVLRLEMTKGHLLWTMSELSRFSGVKRPTIYEYFGSDKEVIVKESWKFMIDTIFCLSTEESLGVRARIRQTVDKINEMPFLFVLFFLEKNKENEIGQMIRTGEENLLILLKQTYKEISKEDIFEMYIKELGAVAYRSINDQQINCIFPP